jgi:hypothetical protein
MRLNRDYRILWGLSLLTAASLLLLLSTLTLRSGQEALRVHAATLDTLYRDADLERRHLLHYLKSQVMLDPVLVGRSVASHKPIGVSTREVAVIYLLSSSCGVCPANYDLLARIDSAWSPVYGLAPRDSVGDLRDHIEEWAIQFPILNDYRGTLVEALPMFGTPLLLVVANGRITHIAAGRIRTQQEERIIAKIKEAMFTPDPALR